MRILHTEASPGWGGQELRILKEAEGMRKRGHDIYFFVQKESGLALHARAVGFPVHEAIFKRRNAFSLLVNLFQFIRKNQINVVNTHSSLDAWLGGLIGKLCGCKVIRTRHLSTPIRKGINTLILYNWLADHIVTTCSSAARTIASPKCISIPTGIDPNEIVYTKTAVQDFRTKYGIADDEFLVGTLCVLRSWKGVTDFLQTAKLLEEIPQLKWVIVGAGVSEGYFRSEWKKLHLEKKVIFAGYHTPPYTALAAMDLFLLLSWGHEGVSQALLQAAFLGKPLITTPVGGLGEVCIHENTGLHVPPQNPHAVAASVKRLFSDPSLCTQLGKNGRQLACEKFTLTQTLDEMEKLYKV